MSDLLLVLNAGLSRLKFSILFDQDPPRVLMRGEIDGLYAAPRFTAISGHEVVARHDWPVGVTLRHEDAVEYLFSWLRRDALAEHPVVAVGHRVVHGGGKYTRPALVDDSVIGELEALIPLAPMHQPHSVRAMKAVRHLDPHLPQVACFDTAFHRTQSPVAQAFALPRRSGDGGVMRYGFHGLSCEHVQSVLVGLDPHAAAGRTVVAYLGDGASLSALRNGKSVATAMGFSTLDGLMMGAHYGAIDFGVLLHLLDRDHSAVRDLERLLHEESGLLGLSSLSGDMQALLTSSDARAMAAVDVFVYRISREMGSLAAALGGLDTLIFTGGIGENAAAIRARVCQSASWLGVRLDEVRNRAGGPRVSALRSRVSVWVIAANEECLIASHTRRVLERARGSGKSRAHLSLLPRRSAPRR